MVLSLTWDQKMADTANTTMAGQFRTHCGRGLTT